MTDDTTAAPEFTPADIQRHAADIADAVTGWTWPELAQAVRSILGVHGQPFVDELTQRMLTFDDPAHRAAAVEVALQPWITAPAPPPRTVELTGPVPGSPAPELPQLSSYAEVAEWFALGISELEWFADSGGWLRTATPRLRHYRVSRIPKRDGHRVIEAPKEHLREIQRRLLGELLYHLPAHPAARGFVRGSSTRAFAWPHSDRAAVVRIDLRHCFETIGVGLVRRTFVDAGYPVAVARLLADLCTVATPPDELHGLDPGHAALLRRRHLPQGAPTSPHLTNLVLATLDRRVAGYARANDLHYTRYGDDLAISGDTIDAGQALWVLCRIVADCGFTVHPDKTRVMRRHRRQRLAGLVVNDRPQVARGDYDAVRALLHNAVRTGASAQNIHGHNDFRAHVFGLIAWIGETNEHRRQRLLGMAAQVDWET